MIQYFDNQTKDKTIEIICHDLMLVAHTAPKACGINCLRIITVSGKEKEQLAAKMEEIGTLTNSTFFHRDAQNIRNASIILLIGADISTRNLNCSFCGFTTCENKPKQVPCVFNSIDLGIALGSVVSSAMQYKIDNRILYSAGKAAKELHFINENMTSIFAIPLSATEKNIFFDRK